MKTGKDRPAGKKPGNNKQLPPGSKPKMPVKKAALGKSAKTAGMKGKLHKGSSELPDELSALRAKLDAAEKALKETVKALQKLEQKFHTLIDNASEGIGVVQEGGYITYYNQSFMNLSGSNEEDMRTRRFDEFIFPEDRDIMLKSYLSALKGGSKKDTFVFKLKHKDGGIRWIEANMNLIEWEGKPATLNFMTDITARKKAEDELQSTAIFLNNMVEQSPTPTWISDDKGNLIKVNRSLCKLLDITAEELVGRYNVFSDAQVEEQGLMPQVRDVFEKGRVARFQMEYDSARLKGLPPDSHAGRILDITLFPIRDNTGRITNAAIQIIDLTERRKAEELLRKSEEQYRKVVNNAAEGIIVIQDGKFKYVNPTVIEKSGYALEELLGHKFTEIIYPQDLDLVRQNEARRERGEKFENSFTFRVMDKKGGKVWVESTSVTIDWEGRPAVLSFLSDVTERKEAEDALLAETIFLDSVLDQSPIATWIADSSGTMVRINRACCELFQNTQEELVGKYNIFKDSTARNQGKIPLIRDVFEKGVIARYEVTMDRSRLKNLPPGRDVLTLDVTMFPIKDAGGAVTNVVTEIIDLTDRRKAEKQLEESNRALQKALNDAVDTMAKIVELRDPYTSGHQRRVTSLSVKIAEEMGLGEGVIANIKMAAIIHDIGKIYVPSEILSKPGRLSDIEYGIIKIHSEKGYEIVKSMDLPCGVAMAILQHHEKMDGSGYPDGLKGDQISIEAKIIAVADVVEAMASHRPYRPARGIDAALQEITRNRGTLYDPAVVDACLRLFIEKGYRIED